jgi:S-adenosylmethionine:diacylglycerol 3-amino-3-carboxypropyl transferase
MPRPKKQAGAKHAAHQVTFEPGQWEEVRSLLSEGGSVSAVIQELLAEWVRKKKAEKAGEAWPAIEARLKRLEGKAPPRLDRRETDR